MSESSVRVNRETREIVTVRLFDAPRERVFRMWTDPAHVARWWGPNGFTNTIQEMDVRPGGVWQLVMHGPDGVDYQNKSVYIEVVEPERIVLSHASSPRFQMTATFADNGGKTELTVQLLFDTDEDYEPAVNRFGAVEGLSQTLDRFARAVGPGRMIISGEKDRDNRREFSMEKKATAHPKVVSEAEWRAERLKLLGDEKELTKQRDRVAAQRRRLPMVKVEKDYRFEGPEGKQSLLDLFEGRAQLIVYHFMFDPAWEEGCPGCTGFVDALGDLSMLGERATSFVLVSRAPLVKLDAYKAKKGWDRPWYSSLGSDFNYDYHVTLDESVAPMEYNYRSKAEIEDKTGSPLADGEEHGFSVFFRVGGEVFHTYSCYARGTDGITDAYDLLELTPYGRQEDWEDSPAGWPQKPTYG